MKTIVEYLNEFECPFCGKICKNLNSLAQHKRLCPKNPERVESSFVKYNRERDQVWNKGLSKETDERVRKQSETFKTRYNNGEIVHPNTGKHLSDEHKQKLSHARKEFLKKNPDKVPYLLNHSSKMSYPEQYFMELFALYDIPLQYHKQISYYELDFYNDEYKVYVEIDGEQHYQQQSIIRDQKRTEFLEHKGWRGIRIRWAEWQKYSLTEKQNVLKYIKDMLK